MNPMDYMQTVKNLTEDSIAKNDETLKKINEALEAANEYKTILSSYSTSCDQVMEILRNQSNTPTPTV